MRRSEGADAEMVTRRGLVKLALVVGVMVAALVTAPLPAGAYGPRPPGGGSSSAPPPPPPPPPPSGSTPTSATGATKHKTVNDCRLAAGPNGFGEVCFDTSGGAVTIKQILGKEKLPDCWDEPLTASELRQTHLQNTSQVTWYWQRCLTGIDPHTLTITGDGVSIQTQGPIPFGPGQKPVKLLHNQQRLVSLYAQGRGDYPTVTVVPSPSAAHVRVNEPVAFYAVLSNDRTVSVLGVTMRAHMTQLSVQPLGAGGPTVTCPGRGVAVQTTDTPASVPDACWTTFAHSSAHQPGQAYPMLVTATWEVIYSANPYLPLDQWHVLNAGIQTTSTTPQKVTEIQAIVIS